MKLGKKLTKTFYLDESPLDQDIIPRKFINKRLDVCDDNTYESTVDVFGRDWEIRQRFMFISSKKFPFVRFIKITRCRNWQYSIKMHKTTTTFPYEKAYRRKYFEMFNTQ